MEPRHTLLKNAVRFSRGHRTERFLIQGSVQSKINIVNSLCDFALGDWLVIYMIPVGAAAQAQHHNQSR